jgi:NADPH:quinone reductase-like Zn-dependent oxidoreductase
VAEIGTAVTRFQPGDEVYGETLRGMQWRNGGAFAEYATAPEEGLALKPPATSFEEAYAVPTAGLIALHNLPRRRCSKASASWSTGRLAGWERSRSSWPRRKAPTSPAWTTPESWSW